MDINFIKENAQKFEATTMDAIGFLPSQVGAVKAAIQKLQKKKEKWGLEILESEKEISVNIENELQINVPREHWEFFQSMFDNLLTENSSLILKVEKVVEKVTSKKLLESRSNELQEKLNTLMECEQIKILKEAICRFYINFKECDCEEFNLQEQVEESLQDNPEDIGYVETLIENCDISSDGSLVKGKYVFLINDSKMILETRVSYDKDIHISLRFEDSEIADRIEESMVGLSRIGNIFYPRIGQILAENNIVENIKEVLEDMGESDES